MRTSRAAARSGHAHAQSQALATAAWGSVRPRARRRAAGARSTLDGAGKFGGGWVGWKGGGGGGGVAVPCIAAPAAHLGPAGDEGGVREQGERCACAGSCRPQCFEPNPPLGKAPAAAPCGVNSPPVLCAKGPSARRRGRRKVASS